MPEYLNKCWWNKDYHEDLSIDKEFEDNPYAQKFQDYRDETGDEDLSCFSIRIIKH